MNPNDARTLQTALGVTVDGIVGPKTYAALLNRIGHPGTLATGLGTALAADLPKYAMDTRLRVIHFLARATVETAGWMTLTEYGGPAYFAKYDGRADLGNTQPGDGERFKGRGVIQITGRANYASAAKRFGVDFVAHPELVATPEWAVLLSCAWWNDHGLNAYADADDGHAIGNAINRGSPHSKGDPNGWADQQAVITKLKGLWSC